MTSSIKSKKRVTDFGEVFTSEREVKAMCNLVKDETYRIDSIVLEPACGDGNFLAEILHRKLNTVEKPKIMKKLLDWSRENNVIGLGRWGEHQHYNSDVTVELAMQLAEKLTAY